MSTRTLTIALAIVVAAGSVSWPAKPASAADPGIRVGVIDSSIAQNTRFPSGIQVGNGRARTDVAYEVLSQEFSNVSFVHDSDLESLAALKDYDVIVAPRVLTFAERARNNIRQYVADGGGLVGLFGCGRWDYSASRRYPYLRIIDFWKSPPPAAFALCWEWAELSELYQVSFRNDPLMYQGYSVANCRPPSEHPILSETAARVGTSSITMTPRGPDFNEIVAPMWNNRTMVTLLTYSNASLNGTPYSASGTPAGWAADYYRGRVVYYGFQLTDLTIGGKFSEQSTIDSAKALMIASTRWAGTRSASAAGMNKRANPYGSVYYTRRSRRLSARARFYNGGSIQLRGYARLDYLDPRGRRIYTKSALIGIPTAGTYTMNGSSKYLGRRPRGRYRVKMTYTYWDWAYGGLHTAVRTYTKRL